MEDRPSGSVAAPIRLHGFDALRAFATLLVVMLHAAIAYLIFPMPGLVWATRDLPSAFVDGTFWWIEGFIMPLFFLMAGFFAAGLRLKLGGAGFVRHRAKRLLLPLLFGIVVILPLDLYVWVAGWVCDGLVPFKKLKSLKFDGDYHRNLWGLSHLWFLQYLYLYCVGYALLADIGRRFSGSRFAGWAARLCGERQRTRLVGAYAKPLLLAAPCTAVLWFAPEVVTGFQHGFVPFPAKFLYTIPFFAAGIWMHTLRDDLRPVVQHSGFYLVLSGGAFCAMLPLIHRHLQDELAGGDRLLLAISIALFAWLTVFGLLGQFLLHTKRSRPAVAYVAEASFWIYLLHHPIVGLTQVDLRGVQMASEWKFVLVTLTATTLSLLTYHVAVRRTWIGVMLGGRRVRRLESESGSPEIKPETAGIKRKAA